MRKQLSHVSWIASLSILILAFGAGCSLRPLSNKKKPSPPLAPSEIQKSFEAQKTGTPLGLEASEDRALLAIKKSALGPEYLWNGFIIPQTSAATSHALKSRIIQFKKNGSHVLMLETTRGQIVTQDLPASILLADFPILSETTDALVIDFNQGMRDAFVVGSYFTSDRSPKAFTAQTGAAEIRKSYLDSIQLHPGIAEIRQIAQVVEESNGGIRLPTYEFRHYLRPYLPNESFVGRETSDFSWVGFFEIHPQLQEKSGYVSTYIARWDISKPITFHISANTPAEYQQAVQEGILYWNSAFGREVVRVEMAPAGVSAPDPRFNIIQWVPNDSAGSAYADFAMDPRTGEILHAQVYLTSVFTSGPRTNMPFVVRPIEKHEWVSDHLCEMDLDEAIRRDESGFRTMSPTDEQSLMATRDYLRDVVAHEVGHTLGLRHNFAGSLAANLTLRERNAHFMNYLRTGKVEPQILTTSSVMEYTVLSDAILASAQAHQTGHPLPYDAAAIAFGYQGIHPDPSTAALYCSDSQQNRVDCKTFDSGAKSVTILKEGLDLAIEQMGALFVESHLRSKTHPNPLMRKSIENLPLSPTETALTVTDRIGELLAWLNEEGTPSLRIMRQFPFLTELNAPDALKLEQQWVAEQISQAGGISEVLFKRLPSLNRPEFKLAELVNAAVDEHLNRADVRTGIGLDGKPYLLSEQEVSLIRARARVYFKEVEKQVLERSLTLIAGAPLTDRIEPAVLESELESVADRILLETTSEVIPGAGPGANELEPSKFAQFKYPKKVRATAIKLLSGSVVPQVIDWNKAARARARTALTAILTQAIGEKTPPEMHAKFSRAQQQWILEQTELLALLSSLN